ncbi:MAG TPA: hypothetical protein VM432_10465, partial [Bdellovibrionales bacterium]|nr:hypothetical protein [Bdellovibrionales bacterium]
MKYFARVAVLVFSCVTLTSVGFAKTSTYAKKTSHSKTKSSKKAMSDLDSIQLDEEEDTPTKSARKTASVEAVEDFSEKIEEASKLEKAGDPAKAIALLTPISEKLGRQGLLVLARAHRANKNSIAALKTLELCLSKNSKDYVVQTLIGDVLADTPNTDDAVAAYNAARKMNKNYRPAYEGLLALFEKKQEHYESRMLLTDMVALFKNVPRYYSDLCRLYSNGDFMA